MKGNIRRTISRIAIYGAFLMCLYCTLKVTSIYFHMPLLAQWTNVFMNTLIVFSCYKLGRIAKLPVAHRLLCLVAMLGYTMYSLILALRNDLDEQIVSTMVFLCFLVTALAAIVLVFTLLFRNIQRDEDILSKLEKKSRSW